MVNETRLLNEFLELVQIDSESGKERQIADVLITKLKNLNLDVFEDDTTKITNHEAGNLFAYIEGTEKNAPTIMFNSHMDTVKPGKGVKPIVKDGFITSDGTTILGADNKAGIAAILEAIRVLKEQNIKHGPIQIIFSSGEESALAGVRAMDKTHIKADFGYAFDTVKPVGEANTSAPARGVITAEVFGKKAHAGVAPEAGVSAILIASCAVAKMPLGRIDFETTANIGTFKADGSLNVVNDHVLMVAEVRSIDNEKFQNQMDVMVKALEDTALELGGKVNIKAEAKYPAFKQELNTQVVDVAKRAASRIGRNFVGAPGGGGSDANIFNGYGLPTIVLGVGYKDNHTTKERIAVEELNKMVEMAVAIAIEAAKE